MTKPTLLVKDRPWNDYPIGTKAHAHTGGFWTRVQNGWKWGRNVERGDLFPTPGGDAVGQCIELPPETPPVPADNPTVHRSTFPMLPPLFKKTDQLLWKEKSHDPNSRSIHVTKDDQITITVRGESITMPLERWFEAGEKLMADRNELLDLPVASRIPQPEPAPINDRPWDEYPIGTKALTATDGFWIRAIQGWKWGTSNGIGLTFPSPGADAVRIELPPMPTTEQ